MFFAFFFLFCYAMCVIHLVMWGKKCVCVCVGGEMRVAESRLSCWESGCSGAQLGTQLDICQVPNNNNNNKKHHFSLGWLDVSMLASAASLLRMIRGYRITISPPDLNCGNRANTTNPPPSLGTHARERRARVRAHHNMPSFVMKTGC